MLDLLQLPGEVLPGGAGVVGHHPRLDEQHLPQLQQDLGLDARLSRVKHLVLGMIGFQLKPIRTQCR